MENQFFLYSLYEKVVVKLEGSCLHLTFLISSSVFVWLLGISSHLGWHGKSAWEKKQLKTRLMNINIITILNQNNVL